MKKFLGSIIILLGVLVGCGNSAKDTEPLQFVWFSDGNETEVMQSIIDDFTAQSGIEIELVEVPFSDSKTKVETMIQGGEPPALIRTSSPLDFADYAVDLQGVINPDDYYEGSHGYMQPFDDDTIITMPLDASANGIIYNKELFDTCGVNLPTSDDVWTWPEFETEMEKMIGCSDVKYPGVYDATAGRFVTMIYQYGGRMFNREGTKSEIASEDSKMGFETFARIHEEGILDPTIWAGSGDASSLFRTGQYGFHWSGSWMLQQYLDLPFEWGVTYMPKGENADGQRSSFYGGKYVMALDGSGQEEQAKQFLAYLAQPEVHDKFSSETKLLSPRVDSQADYGEVNDEIEIFQNELENTPEAQAEDWTNPKTDVVLDEMIDTVNECINNSDTCSDSVDKLDDYFNEKLAA